MVLAIGELQDPFPPDEKHTRSFSRLQFLGLCIKSKCTCVRFFMSIFGGLPKLGL